MQTVNVTDIKVKTGVTKTGAKAGEPWELIIIIGDDGSEFTTFDKKAKEVGIGGVMELEPVLKGGKVNFTKFTITKKGQAPAPSGTSNGGEAPEKRQSIEDQNRAGHITDLWIAGKIADDDPLVPKIRAWLDKLGDSKPSTTKASGSAGKKSEQNGKVPPLKDLGDLYTRAGKFGLSPRDVCEAVDVGKGEEIIDLDEAWVATAKKFEGTIKAYQEANR